MASAMLVTFYQKFFVPNLISCLLEVGTNALLIHSFREMKKLRTPSFRLFAILSASDILLAMSSILMDTLLLAVDASLDLLNILRLTSIATRFLFGEFSALMTVLIAVDRYIHLTYPFTYIAIVTPTRSILATITLALVSVAIIAVVTMAYVWNFYKEILATISVFNAFILISSCCIYFHTLKSIKQKVSQTSFKSSSRCRYDKEFSRAVLFILGSQIMLYTPFILIKPISEFIEMQKRLVLSLTFVSQLFIYFQGIANVLIFVYFHKETRQFVTQLLAGFFSRKVSPTAGQARQNLEVESKVHSELPLYP